MTEEQTRPTTSIFVQSTDQPVDKTPTRTVRYRSQITPNAQSSANATSLNITSTPNGESSRPVTPASQKNNRYIKFLKDQNLILKQQLDQIRKENSATESPKSATTPIASQRNKNPTVEQIRSDQLLLQIQNLQKEMNRCKVESENQQADKLAQIENLLREKQQYLEEKERFQSEIIRLTKLVEETKRQTRKIVETEFSDKEHYLKQEMNKVRAESKRIKNENDQYLSEIDGIKARINEIKEKGIEVQKQNESLRFQNERIRNDVDILKNKNMQLSIENEQLKEDAKKNEQLDHRIGSRHKMP